MSDAAVVSVSLEVDLDPVATFEVFTEEVGAWSRRDRYTLPDATGEAAFRALRR